MLNAFYLFILQLREADSNRRAAGAVDFSTLGIHYNQTNSLEDYRPGGEAFVSNRVH